MQYFDNFFVGQNIKQEESGMTSSTRVDNWSISNLSMSVYGKLQQYGCLKDTCGIRYLII